jgi:hypothetical protein
LVGDRAIDASGVAPRRLHFWANPPTMHTREEFLRTQIVFGVLFVLAAPAHPVQAVQFGVNTCRPCE